MKKLYILLCLFFALGNSSDAQVTVVEEPAISQLMNDFIYRNQQKTIISGWRIQIITTNDRRKSEAARAKFEGLYPDMRSSWEQEIPFYKVKVGAFETKEELQALLLELKINFPSAIPVVDQISVDELAI